MKVLIVHNAYQQLGGEHRVVQDEISLLKQFGHQVILYSRHNDEIKKYSTFQKIGFFPSAIYSMKTYNEVRALVKAEKPDVAHVHNVFPLISPSVYPALKDSGIPIVQTLHNFRFLCPNGLFFRGNQVCELCKFGNTAHAAIHKCFRGSYSLSALYGFSIGFHRLFGTFRLIDRFIALTEFVKQKVSESGLVDPGKISVLGNFLLDTDKLPRPEMQKMPYFVFMGRLSKEKGIESLMVAFNDMPGIQLKILGTGPLESEIKDRIAKSGQNNIQLMGFVEGSQKWQILNKSFAIIVPSETYETFSLAALEGMAAGTPVIAPNHGCLPYVIEDGRTGLVYERGDPRDLREKLYWLFNNPQMAAQMGVYAQEAVLDKFTPPMHYYQLIRIYQEVIR